MAPPGRRKCFTLVFLPLLVLLAFTTSASALSAVLGIDVGTEYLKAAIARPGSTIEIVLTKDTKRKEAAAIAFKPSRAQTHDSDSFPERLYGGDAVALLARFPGDVYPNLKSLLGLARYSEYVKEYTNRYPGLSLESVPRYEDGNARGTVGFRSQNFGDKPATFMVEELLAMELKNIKANAEATVGKGSSVTDAVITYPAFFTAEEKRALELAADMAGLRLLGMISDGLAVGLNYATSRIFDSISEGAKPEYHLVYDMGAGSTTATVLKFQGRTVKDASKRNKTIQEVQVMGVGYDRTLGGDSLNDLIVKDMINQFVEISNVKRLGLEPFHVKSNGKTMARLWKDAERLRQVLSANSQSSTSFESLYYEDVNFKYSIVREHFEKLASEYADRVTEPLTQALEAAGVTLEDLDSVILHGGAVRTPLVQKKLELLTGGSNKIKTNVNADEAAVFGAAFKAASLSPSFRVKDIRASDISGTVHTLKWATEGKEKQQRLFTSSSQLGSEKQVPIKALEDFKFEFLQLVGSTDVAIAQVETTNLSRSVNELKQKHGCVPLNISTTFSMRLSPANGLPEVISGSVSCKVEPIKEGSVMENVKGLFGFGSKKTSEQEPLQAGEEGPPEDSSTTMTASPVSDPTSSTSSSPSSENSDASQYSSDSSMPSSKSAKTSAATPQTVIIPLAFKATPLGLNTPPTARMSFIRQRLAQFDSSDRAAVLRSEALNTLEAFTYRARDYLSDQSFIAVSSDKFRQMLEEKLSATSEWLYGEGADGKVQEFKEKLQNLQALVDPVLKRKDESSRRDQAVKGLKDGLENMSAMIKMVESSIEKSAQYVATSLGSAASSAAESAMSSSGSSPSDDADGLDDDPYSSSTTEAGAAESTPEAPMGKPYEYTVEDLSTLTKAYDSVKSWLDEKIALQEKLRPYDDPVLWVSDLDIRAEQLQRAISDLILKTIKIQEVPKRGKNNGGKKDKGKTKKTKNKDSNSSTLTVSSAVRSSTTSSAVPTDVKDEL